MAWAATKWGFWLGATTLSAFTPEVEGAAAEGEPVAEEGASGFNPFKGKTPQQLDEMFRAKGFEPKGPDPISGRGSYINPQTGRKYYIDPGGTYKKGTELPHVDVHRPDWSPLPKRKFPLGDSLYGN